MYFCAGVCGNVQCRMLLKWPVRLLWFFHVFFSCWNLSWLSCLLFARLLWWSVLFWIRVRGCDFVSCLWCVIRIFSRVQWLLWIEGVWVCMACLFVSVIGLEDGEEVAGFPILGIWFWLMLMFYMRMRYVFAFCPKCFKFLMLISSELLPCVSALYCFFFTVTYVPLCVIIMCGHPNRCPHIMYICSSCKKNITPSLRSIRCNTIHAPWTHIKCRGINIRQYTNISTRMPNLTT